MHESFQNHEIIKLCVMKLVDLGIHTLNFFCMK